MCIPSNRTCRYGLDFEKRGKTTCYTAKRMDFTPDNTGVSGAQVEAKTWREPPSRRQDKSFVSILVKHICRAANRPPFVVETLFRGIDKEDIPAYLKQQTNKDQVMDAETVTFLKSLARPISKTVSCIGVTDQAHSSIPLWSVRGVDNHLIIVNFPEHLELY